jgi:hypothetical protein
MAAYSLEYIARIRKQPEPSNSSHEITGAKDIP